MSYNRFNGTGIEIGVVFGALILGVAKNPSIRGQLFAYAILGLARNLIYKRTIIFTY